MASKPIELNYDDIVEPSAEPLAINEMEVELLGIGLEAGGHEFVLASIHGWPETKTDFEVKCIRVFGKKICTKVPVVYHRTSKLEVIAEISHPDWDTIRGDIEDCVRQAAAAGVAAGALSGNIAAALAAFEGYLKTCLATKGVRRLGELQVGLNTRKTAGPWH